MNERMELKEIADFLQNILNSALEFTEPIKDSPRNPQSIYAISLYAYIIKYSRNGFLLDHLPHCLTAGRPVYGQAAQVWRVPVLPACAI